MKKALCILLSVVFVFSLTVMVSADERENILKFREDGTFKILQINDTQDVGSGVDERTIEFLIAAVELEQPDLVVFAGDQLADSYPFATKEDILLAIDNIIAPLEERSIPFLVTVGNHDLDHTDVLSKADQRAAYSSYSSCYMPSDGWDEFTVNVPVYSSNGEDIAMSVFMMNTHNKTESGGYSGVVAQQNEWFENVSEELKLANGGNAVPSIVFQHIPVKEIFSFLKECEYNEPGALYADRDGKWYVLDEEKADGVMGEIPASEDYDHITGQYESWLKTGNVIGAFFAHDHVNNFVGTTEDGIKMGYNAGAGFSAYGSGSDRSVRVFEFNENDIESYTTRLVTYKEATGKDAGIVFVDYFSPAFFNPVMKIIYFLFGWLIEMF